jgi:enamine deaminase RidA (YjgF/YER057c/UK114 family)
VSRVADRLIAAGMELPPAPTALGRYVPARRAPVVDGSLIASGVVGREVDAAQGAACARRAALNCLAAASTVCDLDEVASVLKLTGYVASADGFTGQPLVVDGASEVIALAFGDAGTHARAAVGVVALPLGAPVEIELVLALRQA